MKFHAIRLSNLNSLRGQVAIDFDKAPFVNTGLFAITGDTGSGKTTLLDAVTLALFAETSRAHEREVMTNGTTECLAEVEFSNENGRFLARWSQKRSNRKADALPVTRELALWEPEASEWRILASGKTEVDGKGNRDGLMAQKLGMGYEQFKRTVLLAQGEFAAFLSSDEKTRAEVLERLTDAEIYAQISKAAFERFKATRTELDKLELLRSSYQVLTADEMGQYKIEQAELSKSAKQLDQELVSLRLLLSNLKKVEAAQTTLDTLQRNLQDLTEAEAAAAPEIALLDAHRDAWPLASLVAQFREQTEASHHLQEEYTAGIALLQATQTEVATLQTTQATATQQRTLAEQQRQQSEPMLLLAIQQDEQLQFEQKALEGITGDLEQQHKRLDTATKEVDALIGKRTELEQSIKAADAWLTQNTQLDSLTTKWTWIDDQYLPQLREIHGRLRKLEEQRATVEPAAQQALSQFQQAEQAFSAASTEWQVASEAWSTTGLPHSPEATVAQLSTQLAALEDFTAHFVSYRAQLLELGTAREQQEGLSVAANQTLKLLLDAEEDLSEAERTEQLKRRRYEREQQTLNYERDRSTLLISGEPCPLCGSLHHPYLHEKEQLAFVNDAESEWSRALDALELVQVRHTRLQVELGNIAQALKQIEQRFGEVLQEQAIEYLHQPNEAESKLLELDQLANRDPEEPINEQELSLQIKTLQIERDEAAKLQIRLKTAEKQLNDAQTAQLRAENEHQKQAERLRQIQEDIEELSVQSVSTATTLNDVLAPFSLQFSPDKQFKDGLDQLRAQSNQYQQYSQQKTTAAQSMAVLEAEIIAEQKDLVEKKAEIEEENTRLELAKSKFERLQAERLQTFSGAQPAAERNRLQQAESDARQALEQVQQAFQTVLQQQAARMAQQQRLETELTTTQKKSERLAQQLLQKGAKFQLTDALELAAALENMLLPEAQATMLQQAQQERADRAIALNAQRTQTQQELTVAQSATQDSPPLAALELQIQETVSNRLQIEQRMGAMAAILANNDQNNQQATDLLLQIQALSLEAERQNELKALIGSQDGSLFRRFAQGLTLEQLVRLANRHLERLQGGRYQLIKKTSTDLELEICDTFQADFVRSVNTLSGGETFLVSLALALGLADMSDRKTKIQSLFIDEGFGALDETSLEMAIETLEGLQAQGLTVGVITHIREMINRISTQIRVVRQPDGFSTIELL